MNTAPTNYHPNKLKPLVKLIARMIKDDPRTLYDIDDTNNPLSLLNAKLAQVIPGFNDASTCLNCGASMAQYTKTLDVNDALLIINTAKHVRENLSTMDFTEANKVRISSADGISHTQKCRTTKCSKLGLIAKSGDATWDITTRGWDALRGEEVPKTRTTFRGKIIERQEALTTFGAVFAEHQAKMQDLEARKKTVRNDHRPETSMYDPREWFEVSGYETGKII